jgi:hypothetical protein
MLEFVLSCSAMLVTLAAICLLLMSIFVIVHRVVFFRRWRKKGRFMPWEQVVQQLEMGTLVIPEEGDYPSLGVFWVPDENLSKDDIGVPDAVFPEQGYLTNCPLWLSSKRRLQRRFPHARIGTGGISRSVGTFRKQSS